MSGRIRRSSASSYSSGDSSCHSRAWFISSAWLCLGVSVRSNVVGNKLIVGPCAAEVVDARLAAAATVAPLVPTAGPPALPPQDPPIAPAPPAPGVVEVGGGPAHQGAANEADEVVEVGGEPAHQGAANEADQVVDAVEAESDEEGGEDVNDEDGDGTAQASGPPIEMADDEPEDARLIEESVAENLYFPREKDALREGMEILHAIPIEDSMVERLSARIAWSSLAIFGIKLMSQVFTAHCKRFTLLIVLPPLAQWDRIDWLSIDSILDDAAQRASKDAKLELSFLGAFMRREDELPSIYASLIARLPLLVARKRWAADYDKHALVW